MTAPKGVRRMLKRLLLLVPIVTMGLGWYGAHAAIVEGEPRIEVWTDRGTGGVYQAGDNVEISFRADRDCYVVVYDIDTDGYLRLLFPYRCESDGFVEAGRVYTLGKGFYGRYHVSGPTGEEYVHALASLRPFRTLYWHGCDGYENYAYDVSWNGFSDYWGCALPDRINGDPYMAMESIDEFICYDALEAGISFADFTYFYVDRPVSYPRFLCYDCHGFNMPYRPYVHVCSGFSIAFVDCDPCWNPWSWWWWCTPTRLYCGPRYVCSARGHWKGWPSQYKWKSRSECYPTRTEYAHYWDERVRTKPSGAVNAGGEQGGTRDRNPGGREPTYVNGGDTGSRAKAEGVSIRDGKVRIIRPVEVKKVEVEKEKVRAVAEPVDRERAGEASRTVVKVREEAAKSTRAKGDKPDTKRVAVKPEKKPVKVAPDKAARTPARGKDAGSSKTRAPSVRSSNGTKRVAPAVRSGNSDRRGSPSRRRSLSK
jgi:hypothetical protein